MSVERLSVTRKPDELSRPRWRPWADARAWVQSARRCRPQHVTSREPWAYFGSFGDDFFDDPARSD